MAQVAKNLAISESCLRRSMSQFDIDSGRVEGLSSDERCELVGLRRKNRVLETEIEILKGLRLVYELAAGKVPVAVACRMLKVSMAGY